MLFRNLADSPPVRPSGYFQDLTKFLEEFPIQHWTQEYIILILKKIKLQIQNYYMEDFCRQQILIYA